MKSALIWKSFRDPLRERGCLGIGNYKLLSAVLALVMIVLYVIFTFFVT
jgi:SSS family solute:Na+ symporter